MTTSVKDITERFNAPVYKKRLTTCQIISIIVFSSVSIASLTIGIMKMDDCPIKKNIPLWLIVNGAIGIASGAFMIVAMIINLVCCTGDENDKICKLCTYLCNLCIGLGSFVWFILGNIWILPLKNKVQFNDPGSDNYCNQQVFNFAFAIIICCYAVAGLLCCFMCCCACCVFGTMMRANEATRH